MNASLLLFPFVKPQNLSKSGTELAAHRPTYEAVKLEWAKSTSPLQADYNHQQVNFLSLQQLECG